MYFTKGVCILKVLWLYLNSGIGYSVVQIGFCAIYFKMCIYKVIILLYSDVVRIIFWGEREREIVNVCIPSWEKDSRSLREGVWEWNRKRALVNTYERTPCVREREMLWYNMSSPVYQNMLITCIILPALVNFLYLTSSWCQIYLNGLFFFFWFS